MANCSICTYVPDTPQIYVLCNGYVAQIRAQTVLFWETYPIVCSLKCVCRYIYWNGHLPIIPM